MINPIFGGILAPYPPLNVSQVGSIFKKTQFQISFASDFTKSQAVSMDDFKNTGAFQEQENMNLSDFTNYGNDPDELNATLKSFSKNLLVESEKVGDPKDGAVFISQSDSKLGVHILVNRTASASVQVMTALAIEATTQIHLQKIAPNLKLTFINDPLPGQTLVMQSQIPLLCLSLSGMMGYAINIYEKISTDHKKIEAESGLIKQTMLSGVKFTHIYLSTILFDTICYLLQTSIIYCYKYLTDVDFEGLWLPLVMGSLAMPFYA